MDVVQLGKENRHEYDQLSQEEKEELRAALDEEKKSQTHGLRLTRKGRTKDVVQTCKKVEDLVSSPMIPYQPQFPKTWTVMAI